jgi:hypothetical protein
MNYEIRRQCSQLLLKVWCPDVDHGTRHVFSAWHQNGPTSRDQQVDGRITA